AGFRRDLAAGADELRRALRADAQTSGGRPLRTCPAAPFVECRAQGLELAADQPPAPFGPPLQTRPPLSAAADLWCGRGPATALRLSRHDLHRHDPAALAQADEPARPRLAA